MKHWIRALCAGFAALLPVVAQAAIDNSHHDMIHYRNDAQKCAYCHSKTVSVGGNTGYGTVGTFCVIVCHVGTGTNTPNAEPKSSGYFVGTSYALKASSDTTGAAILKGGHKMDVGTNMPVIDQKTSVSGTNWPHATATGLMECTTCHSVHDATNPPFLNAPLATGSNTAFCIRCHAGGGTGASGNAGRYVAITGMGAHPVEFKYLDGAVTTRAAPKLERDMNIKSTLLQVVPKTATSVTNFNNDKSGHVWNTGGHFVDTSTGLPTATITNGVFGCYTCHAVHLDATGAAGETGVSTSNLILGPYKYTGGTGDTSLFCNACHGAATHENNPGKSTAAYHPCNEEAKTPYAHDHTKHATQTDPNIPNTGSFPIEIDADLTAANIGANYIGATGEILCVTCHNVHGGVTGLMAIRQLGTPLGGTATSTTQSVCLSCHASSTGTQSGSNWHHPGTTTNYTSAAPSGWGFPTTIGWETTDGLGKLSDGLSCPDCHVFQGTDKAQSTPRRATAHNW